MGLTKYSALPDWFFDAKVFLRENNNSSKNFKSTQSRIPDFDTFPSFSGPSNKVFSPPETSYNWLKTQEGLTTRRDLHDRVGYNFFPKMTGIIGGQTQEFLNAYARTQQIAFKSEGGSLYDNNINLGLGTDEILQWINGEQGIGYSISPSDTTKINQMVAFMDSCRYYQPNSKFGIYSLQAFSIWDKFYTLNNASVADELCAMLNTPPDSIQATCGMDFLMEDLYATESDKASIYGALGMFQKQLARKKFALTGNPAYSKLYYLLWSHTEFFGSQLRYRKPTGEMVSCGELGGLAKHPANPVHNHSLSLYGATGGDGFWYFNDRVPADGNVNINGTTRDLEIENVDGTNGGVDTILNVNGQNQNYRVAPAIIWLGHNQYSAAAIWQASQWKDIIQDNTHDWFTPDFIHNGVNRTGDFKQIPYNVHYKEPSFEVKYSADKSECLIYACNFMSDTHTPKMTIVKVLNASNQEVQIPILLKGRKAELIRHLF